MAFKSSPSIKRSPSSTMPAGSSSNSSSSNRDHVVSASSSSPSRKRNAHGGGPISTRMLIGYTGIMCILVVIHTSRQSSLWGIHHHVPGTDQSLFMLPHAGVGGVANNQTRKESLPTSLLRGERTAGENNWNDDPRSWNDPLGIPRGRAPNLPAIQNENNNKTENGQQSSSSFASSSSSSSAYNTNTISPAIWKHMIEKYDIHSLLDVGCGRGISTLWFLTHGVDALCVEDSPDAVKDSLLPDPTRQLVEHDFTRGPWWPAERTYDAVWAVDFLEHVRMEHSFNYITAFRKAALLFVSTAQWSESYLQEVHNEDWWIQKFEMYGFRYSDNMTKELRLISKQESSSTTTSSASSGAVGPNGMPYQATHLTGSIKVFVNPVVASLPEHVHLLQEPGCATGKNSDGKLVREECSGGKTGNDNKSSFTPIRLTKKMDEAWEMQVKQKFGFQNVTVNATTVDPYSHPLLRYKRGELKLSELPVLPVSVWPLLELGIGNAESLHIEQNGVNESAYLSLTDTLDNDDPNTIWVGDTGYGFGFKPWCIEYHKRIVAAKEARKQKGLPLQWPVFIMDFTDAAKVYQKCPQIEEELGKDFVRYSKRSIVDGRHFKEEENWVWPGERINLTHREYNYTHTPLVVRTDTIAALKHVLESKYNLPLNASIEKIGRRVDVSHFWPTDGQHVGQTMSQLRHHVSATLEAMGKEDNLKVFVGLAGDAVRNGRRGVKSAYIEAMLDSKIVVVTQRDSWEDHYRLFEALVSGALVITDRMLSLPHGLQNGTSVIEVTSTEDLRSKILYFLAHEKERFEIARQGRLTAMTSHRTWHRIEEIIFGVAVTKCAENKVGPCPFIVHGNESRRRRRRRR